MGIKTTASYLPTMACFFFHFCSFILTFYPDISILHTCENANKTQIGKDRNLFNIFHERIILEKHHIFH